MNKTTRERHNLSTAHHAIARRVDFDCNGTLHGERDTWSNLGRLPMEYVDDYVACRENCIDFYVVKSYATPIAWFANGRWFMPDVKYSVTTSRHQGVVRKAIA